MKIHVTVSNALDDLWADAEEFKDMTNEEIVELIKEDVISFLEGASWSVEREP